MNVAMMQPGFMPWPGLFELIYKSDIFIFLDDFQFSVQSYDQRNRMFIDKGRAGWYTIPVQKSISFKAPLNKTGIHESLAWREKIWKRITFNYRGAPYFAQMSPSINEWLFSVKGSLAELNMDFIKLVCSVLDLKPQFRISSEYATDARRSRRVLELLRWCGAKRYFCARGSFDYMRKDNIFPVIDIEVLFQDYIYRPYKQVGAVETFLPHLSILDALMNIGAKDTAELVQNGTEKWATWQEMAAACAT
mgnify:CR=1 FL=1